METYLLIARSVTHAQRMVRILENCGIRAGLFRAPAGLTTHGCSYAVRIRAEQLLSARSCLDKADLQPLGIFVHESAGYREVIM